MKMKLSEKTTEEVKELIIPYLDKLIKDYRDDMDGEESEWFATRVAEYLHQKIWVTENHFATTCCSLVENYPIYKKISVAAFKTAFAKLYDK